MTPGRTEQRLGDTPADSPAIAEHFGPLQDFNDEVLAGKAVDVVVSDMAPNLSGVGLADAARMADLIELAADFAVDHLKPDGALLVKCFHGSGYSQSVERFKRTFLKVSPRKPKASRDKSAETYLLGRGLKRSNV